MATDEEEKRRVIIYFKHETFMRMKAEAFHREQNWTDICEQALAEWLEANGTAPAIMYAPEEPANA